MSLFTDLLGNFEIEKRFLVVLEPYDPGVPGIVTLYYSSHGFTTEPGDTPANTYYAPRLKSAFSFKRSLFSSGKLSGRSVPGNGSLVLVNSDGGLDALATYGWGGRRVRVYLGGSDFALTDFGLIFDGTAENIAFSDADVTINLRDLAHVFDREIQSLTFAGTGGVEGSTDLTNKRKPMALGVIRNVAPVYLGADTGKHMFSLSSGAIIGVLAVRDRGALLTYAASPSPGEYSVDLDAGTLTLGGSYDGPITVDIIGRRYLSVASSSSVTIGTGSKTFTVTAGQRLAVGMRVRIVRTSNRPAAWMDGKITSYSGTSLVVNVDGTSGSGTATDWSISPWGTVAGILRVLAGDAGVTTFDDAGLTALDAAQPATVGWWIGEGGNGLAVMDSIAGGAECWWGFDRAGAFGAGRVDEPFSSSAEYGSEQIIDDGGRSIQRIATEEPSWQFTVKYKRNWSPLTLEQVAAVADADKPFLVEQWRQATAEDGAVLTAYSLSKPVEIESIFDDEADAQDEADRQLVLFGARRDYFNVPLKVQPLSVETSDTVTIIHARYGLSGGKEMLIVDMEENMDAFKVDIGVWG